jgi:membrane-associated protein
MARALVALALVSGLAVVALTVRTYHAVVLLRTAQALGAPGVGNVRPWMTLGYVADIYHVAQGELVTRLGLPADEDPRSSLRSIANRQGRTPISYVQQVQQVLVGLIPAPRAGSASAGESGPGNLGQEMLAAVLAYGYPVLGLVLLLGALGVPLPDGLATVVAGSLAASGKLDWTATAAVALSACVAGDLVGYGLGRLLDAEVLIRRGAWLGYNAVRHARVQAMLDRWGALTVLLTRTMAASLSGPVNLVAGAARYRLRDFAAQALAGRLAWTGAYLAIGYVAGPDLDAASSFLLNFSLLLIMLAVFTGSSLALARRRTPS